MLCVCHADIMHQIKKRLTLVRRFFCFMNQILLLTLPAE